MVRLYSSGVKTTLKVGLVPMETTLCIFWSGFSAIILKPHHRVQLRTRLRIPSPLTPCYFQVDASFIPRLANTDDIDRPIYGLSAQIESKTNRMFGPGPGLLSLGLPNISAT